jgi:hypothetical protein
MSRKKKRGGEPRPGVIVVAGGLPPESRPHKHFGQLIFAEPAKGSGLLGLVGRELHLVWYKTEKDRKKQHDGLLVCALEFKACRKQADLGDERYCFDVKLMEDMSGNYRHWASAQPVPGCPLGEDTDVVETEISFSIAVRKRILNTGDLREAAPAHPFSIHKPDTKELSSPQVDMIWDVMSFLYHAIPGYELMHRLEAEHIVALKERKVCEGADLAEKKAVRAAAEQQLQQIESKLRTAQRQLERVRLAAEQEMAKRENKRRSLQERSLHAQRALEQARKTARDKEVAALAAVKKSGAGSAAALSAMKDAEQAKREIDLAQEMLDQVRSRRHEAEQKACLVHRRSPVQVQSAETSVWLLQEQHKAAQRERQQKAQAEEEAAQRLCSTVAELDEIGRRAR